DAGRGRKFADGTCRSNRPTSRRSADVSRDRALARNGAADAELPSSRVGAWVKAAMIDDDQNEVIGFLSKPGTYGYDLGVVETIRTHASIVFLAGDLAIKLKRAVTYPYLDFSERELRRRACEAELALNRRTAPELYLAVRSVNRETDGRLAF